MTDDARLSGYGTVCINAAVAATVSWVPVLAVLSGAEWATPEFARNLHVAALGFMLGAPLGFGVQLLFVTPSKHLWGVLGDWALRCFSPCLLFVTAIRVVLHLTPKLSLGVVAGLLLATLPLGVYGVLLRSEAAADQE